MRRILILIATGILSCDPEKVPAPKDAPTELPLLFLEALKRNDPRLLRAFVPEADDLAVVNIEFGTRPFHSAKEEAGIETSAAYMTPMAPERLERASKDWEAECRRQFLAAFAGLRKDLVAAGVDLEKASVVWTSLRQGGPEPLKELPEYEGAADLRSGNLHLHLRDGNRIARIMMPTGITGLKLEELRKDGRRQAWMQHRAEWANYIPRRFLGTYMHLGEVITLDGRHADARIHVLWGHPMGLAGGVSFWGRLGMDFPEDLPEKQRLKHLDAILTEYEMQAQGQLGMDIYGRPEVCRQRIQDTAAGAPAMKALDEQIREVVLRKMADAASPLTLTDLKLEYWPGSRTWK